MCDRRADPSASPHRHCDACNLPFAKLSLVAVLDVLHFHERELDDSCIDRLRAAGAIIDFIRELDVQDLAA